MARRGAPPPKPLVLAAAFSRPQGISGQFASFAHCNSCETRKPLLRGEGNPHAELVFVGNSPIRQEGPLGSPIGDEESQLLNRMIEAMGLKREQVFIAHIVNFPSNLPPLENPSLTSPLTRIQPKVIVALGELATQSLLQTERNITDLRGKFHPLCICGPQEGSPQDSTSQDVSKIMPTFHPSDLLKNPASKRETWSDLQKVAKALGIEIPKR